MQRGLGLAKRQERKRAATAVARKLAAVMLRMLQDTTSFQPKPAAVA
jgi:hypothetical protein